MRDADAKRAQAKRRTVDGRAEPARKARAENEGLPVDRGHAPEQAERRDQEEAARTARIERSTVPGPAAIDGTERVPAGETGASWVAEFAEMENSLRMRHYSPRTLRIYMHWVRRFQAFARSKPPQTLSVDDVKAFLTDLAVDQGVSASTQNQAFNSLLC